MRRLTPWIEFRGGWKALEIGYETCCENDRVFREAIRRNSHSDLYIQERELFGFFTTGMAAVESFFYALYAFGWMLNRGKSGAFTLIVSRPEQVTLEKTHGAFREEYGESDYVCNQAGLGYE